MNWSTVWGLAGGTFLVPKGRRRWEYPKERRMKKLILLVLLYALGGSVAFAAPAKAEWDTVVKKILEARDYRFRYDYRGPKGKFAFDYSVVRDGPKVRTKILKGSDRGRGTVILYDPDKSLDSVSITVSLLTLSRSLEAEDVKGSSLYNPLYEQILGKLEGAELSDTESGLAGELYVFEKGSEVHRVRVHPETRDIIQYSKSVGTHLIETLTFSKIQWNRADRP